jgi:hypothetical protein
MAASALGSIAGDAIALLLARGCKYLCFYLFELYALKMVWGFKKRKLMYTKRRCAFAMIVLVDEDTC